MPKHSKPTSKSKTVSFLLGIQVSSTLDCDGVSVRRSSAGQLPIIECLCLDNNYESIGPSATDESFADAIPEAPTTKLGDSGSGRGPTTDDDEFLQRFKDLGKDSK